MDWNGLKSNGKGWSREWNVSICCGVEQTGLEWKIISFNIITFNWDAAVERDVVERLCL